MISLYELQPGSLLCYEDMAAKVCMLDLVDESLMIALETGEHKMIHKDTMHLLQPMPLNKRALRFLPTFKKGIADMCMAGGNFFLKADNESVVLQDQNKEPLIRFYHILAMHQLQGLYRLLTGASPSIAFDHFLQEA